MDSQIKHQTQDFRSEKDTGFGLMRWRIWIWGGERKNRLKNRRSITWLKIRSLSYTLPIHSMVGIWYTYTNDEYLHTYKHHKMIHIADKLSSPYLYTSFGAKRCLLVGRYTQSNYWTELLVPSNQIKWYQLFRNFLWYETNNKSFGFFIYSCQLST